MLTRNQNSKAKPNNLNTSSTRIGKTKTLKSNHASKIIIMIFISHAEKLISEVLGTTGCSKENQNDW